MAKREVQYVSKTPAILPEAGALIERIFREELDLPMADRIERERDLAAAAYDESRDVIETAELDGKLVGAVVVTHDDIPVPGARLLWLGVDASYRGRGIGRHLVLRGVEACRQRRLPALRARTLAVSPALPHVFWMHGFRVIDFGPP